MDKELRIGQIGLSFHRASAAYISFLLEHLGYHITVKEAKHEAAFDLLGNNEIDILISAWLPGSHGKYLKQIEDKVMELGVIYEPYCIWGVPEYTQPGLITVTDLRDPAIAASVNREIHTVNPGAGISRFSVEMMEVYQLTEAGYKLSNLDEDAYVALIESAIARREEFVMPLWHPQFLHYKYKFRELKDPLGLLRSSDKATLLIRKELANQLLPGTIERLKHVYLGNEKISALDYLLNVKHMQRDLAIQKVLDPA